MLALSSCARPIVRDDIGAEADDESDAGLGEPDAELQDVVEPPEDAGSPKLDAASQESDGSCPDGDEDTVCDADDNCPSLANPGQQDGNEDGIGDACETTDAGAPMTACESASVPASQTSGDAMLSNVRVNGMSGLVTVRKGQRLSVTLSYAFGECSIIQTGQLRAIVLGLGGKDTGECRNLVDFPCIPSSNTMAFGDVTLTLDAPTVAGPAYIVAAGRQGFGCSESLTGAKRVAALCVE